MSRGDRGTLSLELVALFGALLMLILLVVQGASWWFDRQVALGAAREGAAVAADGQHSVAEARQVATAFLNRAGWIIKDKPVVDVSPVDGASRTVTVVVHASVRSVLGGLALPVTVQVTVSVERFVGANG